MATTQRPKVLVTGGAGLIGSLLIRDLSESYEFSSFDLKKAEGVRSVVGDLQDFDAVAAATEGQDAVVHLAADTRVEADWDSALKNNFISTYNVFEAAKRAGVQRVVFASSQHATGGFYLDEPWKHICNGDFHMLTHGEYELVDETCPIRPDGFYGASKAYGEALGSYYHDYHQLSSIHVRIGWCMADNDPTHTPFGLTLWLSHQDVVQFFDCCLKTDEGYGVYFATSDNRWKIFDISKARAELGYEPKDGAGEEWTPKS